MLNKNIRDIIENKPVCDLRTSAVTWHHIEVLCVRCYNDHYIFTKVTYNLVENLESGFISMIYPSILAKGKSKIDNKV